MRQRHSVVRGRIIESGDPYDARDPALLMWVAATLIDSAIWTYEHLVEALSDHQREQFYAEQRRWFWVHGIEPEQAPTTYSDFRAYMNQMLHGSALRVTGAASAVVEALLEQEPSVFVTTVLSMQPSALLKVLDRAPARRASLKVLVTWAGALMPARLREAFGLPWGFSERAIWAASVRGLRWVVPTLPPSSRYNPIYLAAVKRMGANGHALEV
jgi:uncharacterized protein (DUF2236 family)